jgi:hypothetical protein
VADTKATDSDLGKEACKRLKAARAWKAKNALDFKEAYFFAAPQRQRQITSETAPSGDRAHDEAELQTSLGIELCTDFVTEVVNTYMPEAQRWCERGRGMFIGADDWDKIKEQVRKDDEAIFDAIKSSNLYSETPKAYNPDLAIGTAAVWIDRPMIHQAIAVLAVPLREFECNLGPWGEIDDRFQVRYTRNCHIKALLPGIELPKETELDIKNNPETQTELVWAFWRLWERHDDECWQHVILIKDKKVHDKVLVGEGSCPLIPARFNPSADWAWGIGPLLQGLPDLRQADELAGAKMEHLDLALRGPVSFPNDSWANIESGGFETGGAYPIQPGSEGAIKRIYDVPPMDQSAYVYDDVEKRLRRMFFVDFPEQTGDTPPTLGQWLDEMARAQRRIGTPGMPFWREGPARYFLRFKFLLEAAGAIKPVQVDGKSVSLMPYNPAQRAAEQQEIATAAQAAQILTQMFPEEWKLVIDGKATIMAFIAKMRVSGLLVIRKEGDVQRAVDQLSQLFKGKAGGLAPGQPTALSDAQVA